MWGPTRVQKGPVKPCELRLDFSAWQSGGSKVIFKSGMFAFVGAFCQGMLGL